MSVTRTRRQLVCRSFLFRGLPEEEVDWALSFGTIELAARGSALYSPAKFRHSLGLVLAGRVRVTRGELAVSILEPGDWFGAAALFNGREAYPSTLTALCTCEVLFLTQEQVSQLMARQPQAAANYIGYLSGRICFLSDRLDSLAAGTAQEKVRQFLLAAADGEGQVNASAAGIAKALNLGRASVYRAFDSLERRGVISRAGKSICIRCPRN